MEAPFLTHTRSLETGIPPLGTGPNPSAMPHTVSSSGLRSAHPSVLAPHGLLRLIVALTFACLGLLASHLARAQAPFDQLLYATGTTTTDSQGRPWAYLLWASPSPALVKERAFAIYAKPGTADSPQPYVRRSIAGVQTDPIVLAPLFDRAQQLGHPAITLESAIDGMFDQVVPDDAIGLPQKLSAVIRGALRDPEHCENLFLLARLHPAAAMAIGFGHAELLPGPAGTATTFEIRLHDLAQNADLAVVGRVTVVAGLPLVLPAPGAPIETVDASPQGDLNVKLLWPTPPELRRLSLANHGFNVFRVDADLAESQGFHLAPPATAALLQLVRTSTNAHQVNRSPILSTQMLNPAEAAALAASPTNYFFNDGNDRTNPDSPLPKDIFHNGARFYYFVTARDILGRDGLVSPGTLITVCDRMPPPPPLQLRVETAYAHDPVGDTRQQRLVLTWDQNVDAGAEHTTQYYVYRWSSIAQFHTLAPNPLAQRIAGPLPHLPGRKERTYVDDGPGAPEAATHAGQTIWYTVRAQDDGACAPAPNLSGHSSPAFGVLRDFSGPTGGGGRVSIHCVRATVALLPSTSEGPGTNSNPSVREYDLACTRTSPAVSWVEFFARPQTSPNPPTLLGRRYFLEGQTSIVLRASWVALVNGALTPPQFSCRIGTANGVVSETVNTAASVGLPSQLDRRLRVGFVASTTASRSPVGRGCEVHDPVPPENEGSGEIDPLIVTLFPPDGTHEWRLFRRVDSHPSTLIAQGDGTFQQGDIVEALDDGPPANASQLCYFVQYLDEHGNAGPMIEIGCVRSEGTTPIATPILSAIASSGTPADPRMVLEWFCPTYGVERFEVWIGGTPLAPGSDLAPELIPADEAPPGLLFGENFQMPPKLFRRYLTPRIGPALGAGPVFSIPAKAALGNEVTVFVKALTVTGSESPASNVERFLWGNTNLLGPDVRWPARPLPLPNDETYPKVLARVVRPADTPNRPWEGLAVRIGELTSLITSPNPALPDYFLGHRNPVEHVYQSLAGESLLGVVLYRYQVPNLLFPRVSGDVLQVSPLMESIAFESGSFAGQNVTVIRDPFIRLLQEPNADPTQRGIYLLDTHPVVEGARYRYVLVRFRGLTHEPVEIVSTQPVDVP